MVLISDNQLTFLVFGTMRVFDHHRSYVDMLFVQNVQVVGLNFHLYDLFIEKRLNVHFCIANIVKLF